MPHGGAFFLLHPQSHHHPMSTPRKFGKRDLTRAGNVPPGTRVSPALSRLWPGRTFQIWGRTDEWARSFLTLLCSFPPHAPWHAGVTAADLRAGVEVYKYSGVSCAECYVTASRH